MTKKTQDIKHYWGWAATKSGMGTEAEQVEMLLNHIENLPGNDLDRKYIKKNIYLESSNTLDQALGHPSDDGKVQAMVVVGLRVLGGAYTEAMEKLGANGDNLYSIATRKMYVCRDGDVFNDAYKEVTNQRLIPARKALKKKGKKSGPKLKLTEDHLKQARLMINSKEGATLPQVKQALFDDHELVVSVPTLSRRLNPPDEEEEKIKQVVAEQGI